MSQEASPMTAEQDAGAAPHTYAQILKSTLMVGGSSAINIVFSIIRNKAVAVMLGPEGVGLLGVYSSISDIAQTVASLGVPSSGVRQIAEAAGSGDDRSIARTAEVLSRVSILLAAIGAIGLAALALPIADLTFGHSQHALGIALLSLALFLRVVSGGQMALIQGLRDISSLALVNVVAAFASTVLTIPLIYFFGVEGIVPSLIGVAGATLLASWWYSRKIRPLAHPLAFRAFRQEAQALLKLGFVFMASGFLTFGSAYVIRVIVVNANGMAAAGLYQAAWALGGLYAGFILQAMGTDFYPRLTAVAHDHATCNRLVNEQTQISLLLAGPGVIATLTFAPIALQLFYAPAFYAAADLLRWICLGMMLRIVAWPVGFVAVAKGRQAIFFWTEAAATAVHLGLAWALAARFGAVGVGAAFFGLYLWHGTLVYLIARRLSDFRWSTSSLKFGLIFLTASGFVFCCSQFLPLWQSTAIGSVAMLASGFYSLKTLVGLVPANSLPPVVRNLAALLT